MSLKIVAIMPVEIGGSNALTPLCVSRELGLPVLNADLLGRAFREIPMISTNVFDILPHRIYITTPDTGKAQTYLVQPYQALEDRARKVASASRHVSAILVPLICSGAEIKKAAIFNTYTQALAIGSAKNISALLRTVKSAIYITGTIIKREYALKEGFLIGWITLQDSSDVTIKIWLKNEYLLLTHESRTLAKTPDIISLLDTQTLKLRFSDQIQIGDHVHCITCKGPKLWYSAKGMKLMEAFCDRYKQGARGSATPRIKPCMNATALKNTVLLLKNSAR